MQENPCFFSFKSSLGRSPKTNIAIDSYDHAQRQVPPVDPSIDAGNSFSDPRLTLTEEQVRTETARCLGCGATIVDENKCIGCGLCTTRCEFDAIHLLRDHPLNSTMRRAEENAGLNDRIERDIRNLNKTLPDEQA